jgi:hypothetical protein
LAALLVNPLQKKMIMLFGEQIQLAEYAKTSPSSINSHKRVDTTTFEIPKFASIATYNGTASGRVRAF